MAGPNKKEEGTAKDPNQGPDYSLTRKMTSATAAGPKIGAREEFLPSEPYKTRQGNIRKDN